MEGERIRQMAKRLIGPDVAEKQLSNEISAPYEVPQYPIEQIETKLIRYICTQLILTRVSPTSVQNIHPSEKLSAVPVRLYAVPKYRGSVLFLVHDKKYIYRIFFLSTRK